MYLWPFTNLIFTDDTASTDQHHAIYRLKSSVSLRDQMQITCLKLIGIQVSSVGKK